MVQESHDGAVLQALERGDLAREARFGARGESAGSVQHLDRAARSVGALGQPHDAHPAAPQARDRSPRADRGGQVALRRIDESQAFERRDSLVRSRRQRGIQALDLGEDARALGALRVERARQHVLQFVVLRAHRVVLHRIRAARLGYSSSG